MLFCCAPSRGLQGRHWFRRSLCFLPTLLLEERRQPSSLAVRARVAKRECESDGRFQSVVVTSRSEGIAMTNGSHPPKDDKERQPKKGQKKPQAPKSEAAKK